MKMKGLILGLIIVAHSCGTIKAQKGETKADNAFSEALVAHGAGKFDEALILADKAIKFDPKYYDAYGLKGAIYDGRKNFLEAEKAYLGVLPTNDEKVIKYYYFIAELYYRYGYYDKALGNITTFKTTDGFDKSKSKEKALEIERLSKIGSVIKSKPVVFNPINLGANINTPANEYFPGISIDGNYLFFTREVNGNEDIYRANLDTASNGWYKAEGLGSSINSPMNEGSASPTADGKYVFFTECNRENNIGRCDIYFSRIEEGVWSKPMLINPPLNSIAWESQPCISADGKTLYFASNRAPSYGGIDLFKSEFVNGIFQEPVNLGPNVNSVGDEQAPFIHADGQTLYYSSNQHDGLGKNDLFISRFKNNEWGKPENLGYPINTHNDEVGLIVDREGQFAYYASSREGGMGGADLYKFELPVNVRPISSSYVKGLVTDFNTGVKLGSSVTLIDLVTGKDAAQVNTQAGDGSFLLTLPGNKDYLLNVSNDLYLFYSNNFSLTNSSKSEPYFLDIKLKQPTAGEKVVLKNIFFDVDKFDLKSTSMIELDKLVEMLNRFPKLRIEIGGHTDNTGDVKANQLLSEKRAKSVMNYLLSKGITASRLTFKGYGETMPIEENTSPEGKAQNRRTEFKVIGN